MSLLPPLRIRAVPTAIALALLTSLGLLALALGVMHSAQSPADDAYIHLRIARNLLTDGQPYYNLGAPVAGSSSPLWVVLLALTGANQAQSVVLAIAALFGLVGALAWLLTSAFRPIVALVLALILGWLIALPPAGMLMETPLALMFWTLSLIAWRYERWVLAGVIAGVAACTRYELGLWLGLLTIAAPTWAARGRVALGAAGPLAALAGWSVFWYGTLLPNTIRAKSIIYQLTPDQSLRSAQLPDSFPLLIIALAIAMALAYSYRHKPPHRPAALALVFGVSLVLLYVMRGTMMFPWYDPLYQIPLCVGACLILRDVRPATLAATVLLVWAAAVPLRTAVTPGALPASLRVQQYLRIGHDLANAYPTASLMAPEIGALGWAFEGSIIDAVGLASPELLYYHPMPPADRSAGSVGAIPPQAVRDLQPDLVVTMETFSEAFRRDLASGKLPNYRLLNRYPVLEGYEVTLWGSRWIEVYIRDTTAHTK